MRILLLIVGILISLSAKPQAVKDVDAVAFKKLIAEKKGVLIDLRTDEEIQKKGQIKGARQLDFFSKDAEAEILKLDKQKTYLIYCAGGGRSTQCGELMEKNGFTSVINLEKGYDDWRRKGFETEIK